MKNIFVLHISKTPLVGAPGRISYYLNKELGFESIHLYTEDYPNNLKNCFTGNSVLYDKGNIKNKFLLSLIERADIIHVHNYIDLPYQKLIAEVNPSSIKIYQLHSFLREGPLYIEQSENFVFPFDKLLCVNQLHPRLFQKFIPVPNIVDEVKCHTQILNQKPRIIFSPTHKQSGRYGTKYSPLIIDTLKSIELSGMAEVVWIDSFTHPKILSFIRSYTDITIDEIATGGFHQVSLEGLASSNIVINNAESLTASFYSNSIFADKRPPFYICNDNNLKDKLLSLLNDKQRIVELKQESKNYFDNFLRPSRLIKIFVNIYKEQLNA